MIETIKNPKTVKARKNHRCSLCHCTIFKDEEYKLAVFKDDHIYQWKTHNSCNKLIEYIGMFKDVHPGDGLSADDFQESLREDFRRAVSNFHEGWELDQIVNQTRIEYVRDYLFDIYNPIAEAFPSLEKEYSVWINLE